MADAERDWPNPRCDRLARGQVAVLDWLDAQSSDFEDELADEAVQTLLRVGELARAEAGQWRLVAMVRQAREAGWQWAPIALQIGMGSPAAARWFTHLEADARSQAHERQVPAAGEPVTGTGRGMAAPSPTGVHGGPLAAPPERDRAGSPTRP